MMKKFKPMMRIILMILILVSGFRSFAQVSSPQTLDDIKSAAGKNQWEKAKQGIDQYLSQDQNSKNPEAWQLKSLILYKMVSGGDTYKQFAPNGHLESFQAYKKFMELQPDKSALSKDHEILFGVCFNNIERANNEFQHKRYAEALSAFIEVEEMEDYIVKKGLTYQGFSFPAYDTQLYVNIAASAINAGKEETGIKYYQKIADKKITGKGFDGIYRYLVDRFHKKNDKVSRDRYLAIGRELYPTDPYWCQVALRDAGSDKKKILVKYEELIHGPCNNYLTHYNYAIELYNYAFKQATRPVDFSKLHPKIPDILKKAISIQPTVEANLLLSRYHLLLINDLIDSYNAIHENTPEKQKKKDALNTEINKRYEEVLAAASASYNMLDSKTSLEGGDKENFIISAKMLSDYWERKNDKAKQKIYLDKAKQLE